MKLTSKQNDIQVNLSNGVLHIGKEKGYTPLELLVASIAGCSTIVFQTILEKKRVSYDSLTIDTSVRKSETSPNPVEAVHLHYKIQTDCITKEQLEKVLVLAVKNCTIAQSVKDSIEITETIELI
ncbi:osmotically inducible protein C [Bacillus manliponensis]|uniref:Osmotically inducible protein C n=1 Tax=Bacillus manliponensis TaxID=574376 RepID=A0A073JV90_9BACI|nr:OsmC family protein [Bacillus manliponensis]KEK18126.1 osmotically inducible protein C [Bacillus manliponensis]